MGSVRSLGGDGMAQKIEAAPAGRCSLGGRLALPAVFPGQGAT